MHQCKLPLTENKILKAKHQTIKFVMIHQLSQSKKKKNQQQKTKKKPTPSTSEHRSLPVQLFHDADRHGGSACNPVSVFPWCFSLHSMSSPCADRGEWPPPRPSHCPDCILWAVPTIINVLLTGLCGQFQQS